MYCGDPANVVDHIFPHSYSLNDNEANLVASCNICNSIASDKVFDGFIAKQTYIKEERKKDRWTEAINLYRSMCQDAGLPLAIERKEEEKPKKETKSKRRRNVDGSSVRKKPSLPPVYPSAEPEKVVKPVKKVRKIRLHRVNRAIKYAADYSNIQSYQVAFLVKHEQGESWRKIAMQHGLYPNMARLIAQGHEPGNRIRKKLNLPLKSEVIPMEKKIPDGSLVLGSQVCECGQTFVSNHPKRRRCFLCTPFRSRKF
jgi:hypothetical protein